QRRLKGEPLWMFQPGFVVFKGGAFPVLARARPQPSHQIRRALEVHENEDFSVHYSLALLGFLDFGCDSRMRCGRCSSSSSSPRESWRASATSASRSTIPSAKRTAA